MPSIAAHMVVAKLVSDNLKINSPDFIIGNALPDVISNPLSHHKIQGKYYLIPDIDFFREKLDLNENLELGYFTHLLLDKYFLEEFVLDNVKDLKIFENKTIYNEYDKINYSLLKKFDIDSLKLIKILGKISLDVDEEKLDKNIKCLSNKELGETEYLDFDKLSSFLYNISFRISKEIKKYAN